MTINGNPYQETQALNCFAKNGIKSARLHSGIICRGYQSGGPKVLGMIW